MMNKKNNNAIIIILASVIIGLIIFIFTKTDILNRDKTKKNVDEKIIDSQTTNYLERSNSNENINTTVNTYDEISNSNTQKNYVDDNLAFELYKQEIENIRKNDPSPSGKERNEIDFFPLYEIEDSWISNKVTKDETIKWLLEKLNMYVYYETFFDISIKSDSVKYSFSIDEYFLHCIRRNYDYSIPIKSITSVSSAFNSFTNGFSGDGLIIRSTENDITVSENSISKERKSSFGFNFKFDSEKYLAFRIAKAIKHLQTFYTMPIDYNKKEEF